MLLNKNLQQLANFKDYQLVYRFYRSPDPNTRNIFTQDLDLIMKQNENKHIIIYSDANVNILNVENNIHSADYLDLFMANGFIPTITKPTGVTITSATLIDHIFLTLLILLDQL